jgi:predicted nucleotidyltransferase
VQSTVFEGKGKEFPAFYLRCDVELSRVAVSYKRVAERLAERLRDAVGDRIEAIVLYGSVARGEAGKDSDVDLLIIVPDGKIRRQILRVSYDLDLEFGTVTSHVYMTPQEFERYLSWGDPFLREVLKEGIVLYDSGFYSKVRGGLSEQG